MATINVAPEPLYRLAYAVAPLFSDAATFAAPDDEHAGASRLFIRDPFGHDTRPVAFAFPVDILKRYDEMDAGSQAHVHTNVAKIAYARRAELIDRMRNGAAVEAPPREIRFGEEIFRRLR
jgi:hypothetical protein